MKITQKILSILPAKYASRFTRHILLPVFLLPALSAWGGDLSVDNLTVSSDATIYGKVNINTVITGESTNAAVATGGTITTNGGYIYHTYTTVGTSVFAVSGGTLDCAVLVVAGGGGGSSGGGGAGGLIYMASTNVSGSVTVTVGGGGGGDYPDVTPGIDGTNSVFGALTAIGGGGGNRVDLNPGRSGGSGGGGGGASTLTSLGGAGTANQGNDGGGNAGYTGAPYPAGGGGGAGSAGADAPSGSVSGDGGAGLEYSMPNASYYAGGGGGHYYYGTPGSGGIGGGGDGGNPGENGTPNTGSGGGGAYSGTLGGHGGSGIVIMRYSITTSSNITTLSISSNGISQTSASGANVFMGKVGIGTNNPAEQLHVVGNARITGSIAVGAPGGDIPMGVYTNQ